MDVGDMQTNVPHAPTMSPTSDTDAWGTQTPDVGDIADFGIFDPHADDLRALAKGGRIERKPYTNKDKSKRWYWVFRWEARYHDDCRYRPTEYIGKSVTNGWGSKRRWSEDGIRPPCPKHDPHAFREWKAAHEFSGAIAGE